MIVKYVDIDELYPYYFLTDHHRVGLIKVELTETEYAAYLKVEGAWDKWQARLSGKEER